MLPLRRLVSDCINAACEAQFAGSKEPIEAAQIRKDYTEAQKQMIDRIKALEAASAGCDMITHELIVGSTP